MVATDDGASLWVSTQGSGTPLVLSHGGPGLWDYFDELAAGLEDCVTVVRWEQRSCGRSSNGTEAHSIARYVKDLDTIRLALAFDDWIVGGHSWGASLALQYGLQCPDRTIALVYLSGVGIGQEWRAAFRTERKRRLGSDYERLLVLAGRPRTPEEETEYRRLSWSIDFVDRSRSIELAAAIDRPFPINTEANRLIGDEMSSWDEGELAAGCARLVMPAMVIHGTEDPRPAWAVNSLVAALPNVCRLVLEDAGHSPWLEAGPLFFAPLRDFLSI